MDRSRSSGSLAPFCEDRSTSLSLDGCRTDLMSLEQAIATVITRASGSSDLRPMGVVSMNLDHLHHFGSRSRWHDVLDAAERRQRMDWLYLLDGAPLVARACRLTSQDWPRLAGSDLIEPLLREAERLGSSVGFLGGSCQTQELLAVALAETYPALKVNGWWAPDRDVVTDPQASRRLAMEVADAGVDILVVGLGKPRQELWIAEHGHVTGAKVLLAFGAVVDFLAGRVRRAPGPLRDHGLEWAWRLAMEPRRMAKRYLVFGPLSYIQLQRHSGTLAGVPVQRSAGGLEVAGVPVQRSAGGREVAGAGAGAGVGGWT